MNDVTNRRTAAMTAVLLGLVTTLVAGLGSILLSAPGAGAAVVSDASARAGSNASVTLVHGVRGLLADVVVDGKTALKGFAYERASSPMQLPAGVHHVQVFKAGQAHTTALLDVNLTVKAGQILTAAVGFDNSGAPKAYVFDDRLTAAARSASAIVVRNVSQGKAPQVLIDGRSASAGLAAGSQVLRGVRPGSHTVGLKVNGAWLLTNQPVRAASGKAMVVYVVGLQSAKSIALVADSVAPATGAGAVNSGGLPPMHSEPVLPTLLSLTSLGLGLGLLLLLAGRRRAAAPARSGGGAQHAT
jgi:Domain of unknown function (DUF4397)